MYPSASGALRYSRRLIALLTFAFTAVGCSGGADESAAQPPPEQGALLPGRSINVYAAGDIADCTILNAEFSFAAKTAALVAAGSAGDGEAAVLTLGDNTYPDGAPGEFAYCYDRTWGRFKERTYPSPGNHDCRTQQAIGCYGYFAGPAGPWPPYYSFRLGNWHRISLNSNLTAAEHQAELKNSQAGCTLAYWHHPLYSSGEHGNIPTMSDMWSVLQAADADLILAAHDHGYERFTPQDANGRRDDKAGIRQFVVGTGGALPRPLRPRAANSEASNDLAFGVLRLVLNGTGDEWEFLPVDEGRFSDRGAALCR